jgi:hypothetical protein
MTRENEKSKQLGFTLFSVAYAILGIVFLCVSLYPVFLWAIDSPKLDEYVGDEISFDFARYIYAALAVPPVLLLVSSAMLFIQKRWGPGLALIALLAQMMTMGILGMLILPIAAAHIIYFTRPGVKKKIR